VRAQRFLNAIILFACSHSQNKHKLCSNDWFGSLSNGLSVTSATKESLRRLLERTKPFPFAILMASFGMIGLLPITLFAWAAQPAAPVKLVLLVQCVPHGLDRSLCIQTGDASLVGLIWRRAFTIKQLTTQTKPKGPLRVVDRILVDPGCTRCRSTDGREIHLTGLPASKRDE
jgi:hypothetical protein